MDPLESLINAARVAGPWVILALAVLVGAFYLGRRSMVRTSIMLKKIEGQVQDDADRNKALNAVISNQATQNEILRSSIANEARLAANEARLTESFQVIAHSQVEMSATHRSLVDILAVLNGNVERVSVSQTSHSLLLGGLSETLRKDMMAVVETSDRERVKVGEAIHQQVSENHINLSKQIADGFLVQPPWVEGTLLPELRSLRDHLSKMIEKLSVPEARPPELATLEPKGL